ncbi:MAG TPA: SMC family ATPase [Chloroflexia bacterium]|nr:SMC family ATPase [Chloroflexia bacterium]
MIPIRLSLRNFMCYRDKEVLDLNGVHLACLSGENGAGKSAILEAMTWALWGRARGRSLNDELMSHGSTEMEVDFIFALNDQHYRVMRKRALKGKSRDPILELQIADPGVPLSDLEDVSEATDDTSEDTDNPKSETRNPKSDKWRSLSGATIRETQGAIGNLLKIDYDTFVNSAFILQGRADSFTVMTATDRKTVLANILGLDQYDRLEELAKKEARERKSRMSEIEGLIAQIDRELKRRPEYAQDLQIVEEQLITSQKSLNTLRTEVADLLTRKQSLEHSRNRLVELQERARRREAEMVSLKSRIEQAEMRRDQMQALLARREEIESGFAEWQASQDEERRFNELIGALRILESEHSQLEQIIKVEGAALERDESNLERRVRDLKGKLSGREVVMRQLAEAIDQVRKLEQVQQQHEDARCERENLDVRHRTLTAEMDSLKEEGDTLNQKLDLIMKAHKEGSGHVDCPLCGTGLTAEALERVRMSYEKDITDRRRDFKRKRDERDEVKEKIIATERRLGSLDQQIKQLIVGREREAEKKEALKTLDEVEKMLADEQSLLAAVKTKRAASDYAHDARAKQAGVAARMVSLSYDDEAHKAASRRVAELTGKNYSKQHHDLQTAQDELPRIKDGLAGDTLRLDELLEEQEQTRAEIATLQPQVEGLSEVATVLAARQAEERELGRTVDDYIGRRGELKNNLARCDSLQEEKGKYTGEYNTASEEKAVYDELAGAFGKNGIQAMIMENIIPELEDETNALLGRMTDGRMSVAFPFQKETKTTKSVVETFDINISDEMGTRAYEMYSGGEAFRVNFAVRIALSKLLARRAGTQLQTLVIDEGFGSQDGQGREKLVGAIRSIQEDFEKILVITHIEELKEEFPVRINIIKTPTGSKIVMSEEES